MEFLKSLNVPYYQVKLLRIPLTPRPWELSFGIRISVFAQSNHKTNIRKKRVFIIIIIFFSIGYQRADGLFGTLIVNRRDLETVIEQDYDEHRMIVNDWSHMTGDAAFIRMHHYKSDKGPDSILVNGRGRYQKFKTKDNRTLYTPLAVFEVEHVRKSHALSYNSSSNLKRTNIIFFFQDKNYKFRFINAGAEDCPISVSIDNHTLIVTSVDSNDIVATEGLYIYNLQYNSSKMK